MTLLTRLRDLILNMLVAAILVTAFVVYLFTVPEERRLNGMWIPLVLNTAIVFGFLISWFRYAWRNVRYWTVLALLIIFHVAAYVFALRRVGHLPSIAYVAANAAELAVFSQILWKLPSERNQPTNS